MPEKVESIIARSVTKGRVSYLVKVQYRPYRELEWINTAQVHPDDKSLVAKIRKFNEKNTITFSHDDSKEINQSSILDIDFLEGSHLYTSLCSRGLLMSNWLSADRILTRRVRKNRDQRSRNTVSSTNMRLILEGPGPRNSEDGDIEWLVKWCSLPESQSTWEVDVDSKFIERWYFLNSSSRMESRFQETHPPNHRVANCDALWRRSFVNEYNEEENVCAVTPNTEVQNSEDGGGNSVTRSVNTRYQLLQLTEPLPGSRAHEEASDNLLFDFQVDGIAWLLFNWSKGRGSILADEMGLGKTVQSSSTISAVLHFTKGQPALVIAPLSTLCHWQRELEKWAPHLYVIYFHGTQDDRDLILECDVPWLDSTTGKKLPMTGKQSTRKFDVVLTSYETFTRCFLFFSRIKWRICITDEGHRLKGLDSLARSKLCDSEINIDHNILLTGTPIQNDARELWCLLNVVDPRNFVSWSDFQIEFENYCGSAINNRGALTKSLEQPVDSYDGSVALQNRLRPYILRRHKHDVMKRVPAKEEIVIEVEFTRLQKKIYRSIYERNICTLANSQVVKASFNNVSMELRKCCAHPYLIRGVEEAHLATLTSPSSGDELDHNEVVHQLINMSGKLVFLEKLLPRMFETGEKVLIFSQMTRMLDIISDYLTARGFCHERLDGSVTGNDRQKAIDRFNETSLTPSTSPDSSSPPSPSEHPSSESSPSSLNQGIPFVFLLSTRAGGVGINLTAANVVVIYDSDWNPQNDSQAQARCHRIGQKKRVKVYRLITRNSYEQHMFDTASRKLGLEQALMSSVVHNSEIKLTRKEMDKLIRLGAYSAFEDDENKDSQYKEFESATIDDILSSDRAKSVALGTVISGGQRNVFSKAMFGVPDVSDDTLQAAGGMNDEDIVDVEQQSFWVNLVGRDKIEKLSSESREIGTRRTKINTEFLDTLSDQKPEVVSSHDRTALDIIDYFEEDMYGLVEKNAPLVGEDVGASPDVNQKGRPMTTVIGKKLGGYWYLRQHKMMLTYILKHGSYGLWDAILTHVDKLSSLTPTATVGNQVSKKSVYPEESMSSTEDVIDRPNILQSDSEDGMADPLSIFRKESYVYCGPLMLNSATDLQVLFFSYIAVLYRTSAFIVFHEMLTVDSTDVTPMHLSTIPKEGPQMGSSSQDNLSGSDDSPEYNTKDVNQPAFDSVGDCLAVHSSPDTEENENQIIDISEKVSRLSDKNLQRLSSTLRNINNMDLVKRLTSDFLDTQKITVASLEERLRILLDGSLSGNTIDVSGDHSLFNRPGNSLVKILYLLYPELLIELSLSGVRSDKREINLRGYALDHFNHYIISLVLFMMPIYHPVGFTVENHLITMWSIEKFLNHGTPLPEGASQGMVTLLKSSEKDLMSANSLYYVGSLIDAWETDSSTVSCDDTKSHGSESSSMSDHTSDLTVKDDRPRRRLRRKCDSRRQSPNTEIFHLNEPLPRVYEWLNRCSNPSCIEDIPRLKDSLLAHLTNSKYVLAACSRFWFSQRDDLELIRLTQRNGGVLDIQQRMNTDWNNEAFPIAPRKENGEHATAHSHMLRPSYFKHRLSKLNSAINNSFWDSLGQSSRRSASKDGFSRRQQQTARALPLDFPATQFCISRLRAITDEHLSTAGAAQWSNPERALNLLNILTSFHGIYSTQMDMLLKPLKHKGIIVNGSCCHSSNLESTVVNAVVSSNPIKEPEKARDRHVSVVEDAFKQFATPQSRIDNYSFNDSHENIDTPTRMSHVFNSALSKTNKSKKETFLSYLEMTGSINLSAFEECLSCSNSDHCVDSEALDPGEDSQLVPSSLHGVTSSPSLPLFASYDPWIRSLVGILKSFDSRIKADHVKIVAGLCVEELSKAVHFICAERVSNNSESTDYLLDSCYWLESLPAIKPWNYPDDRYNIRGNCPVKELLPSVNVAVNYIRRLQVIYFLRVQLICPSNSLLNPFHSITGHITDLAVSPSKEVLLGRLSLVGSIYNEIITRQFSKERKDTLSASNVEMHQVWKGISDIRTLQLTIRHYEFISNQLLLRQSPLRSSCCSYTPGFQNREKSIDQLVMICESICLTFAIEQAFGKLGGVPEKKIKMKKEPSKICSKWGVVTNREALVEYEADSLGKNKHVRGAPEMKVEPTVTNKNWVCPPLVAQIFNGPCIGGLVLGGTERIHVEREMKAQEAKLETLLMLNHSISPAIETSIASSELMVDFSSSCRQRIADETSRLSAFLRYIRTHGVSLWMADQFLNSLHTFSKKRLWGDPMNSSGEWDMENFTSLMDESSTETTSPTSEIEARCSMDVSRENIEGPEDLLLKRSTDAVVADSRGDQGNQKLNDSAEFNKRDSNGEDCYDMNREDVSSIMESIDVSTGVLNTPKPMCFLDNSGSPLSGNTSPTRSSNRTLLRSSVARYYNQKMISDQKEKTKRLFNNVAYVELIGGVEEIPRMVVVKRNLIPAISRSQAAKKIDPNEHHLSEFHRNSWLLQFAWNTITSIYSDSNENNGSGEDPIPKSQSRSKTICSSEKKNDILVEEDHPKALTGGVGIPVQGELVTETFPPQIFGHSKKRDSCEDDHFLDFLKTPGEEMVTISESTFAWLNRFSQNKSWVSSIPSLDEFVGDQGSQNITWSPLRHQDLMDFPYYCLEQLRKFSSAHSSRESADLNDTTRRSDVDAIVGDSLDSLSDHNHVSHEDGANKHIKSSVRLQSSSSLKKSTASGDHTSTVLNTGKNISAPDLPYPYSQEGYPLLLQVDAIAGEPLEDMKSRIAVSELQLENGNTRIRRFNILVREIQLMHLLKSSLCTNRCGSDKKLAPSGNHDRIIKAVKLWLRRLHEIVFRAGCVLPSISRGSLDTANESNLGNLSEQIIPMSEGVYNGIEVTSDISVDQVQCIGTTETVQNNIHENEAHEIFVENIHHCQTIEPLPTVDWWEPPVHDTALIVGVVGFNCLPRFWTLEMLASPNLPFYESCRASLCSNGSNENSEDQDMCIVEQAECQSQVSRIGDPRERTLVQLKYKVLPFLNERLDYVICRYLYSKYSPRELTLEKPTLPSHKKTVDSSKKVSTKKIDKTEPKRIELSKKKSKVTVPSVNMPTVDPQSTTPMELDENDKVPPYPLSSESLNVSKKRTAKSLTKEKGDERVTETPVTSKKARKEKKTTVTKKKGDTKDLAGSSPLMSMLGAKKVDTDVQSAEASEEFTQSQPVTGLAMVEQECITDNDVGVENGQSPLSPDIYSLPNNVEIEVTKTKTTVVAGENWNQFKIISPGVAQNTQQHGDNSVSDPIDTI